MAASHTCMLPSALGVLILAICAKEISAIATDTAIVPPIIP